MECTRCKSDSSIHIGSKVWCNTCGYFFRKEGLYSVGKSAGFSRFQVVDYLKKYQDWRRGIDSRTMEEAGINPRELGIMLDRAIKLIEDV